MKILGFFFILQLNSNKILSTVSQDFRFHFSFFFQRFTASLLNYIFISNLIQSKEVYMSLHDDRTTCIFRIVVDLKMASKLR